MGEEALMELIGSVIVSGKTENLYDTLGSTKTGLLLVFTEIVRRFPLGLQSYARKFDKIGAAVMYMAGFVPGGINQYDMLYAAQSRFRFIRSPGKKEGNATVCNIIQQIIWWHHAVPDDLSGIFSKYFDYKPAGV